MWIGGALSVAGEGKGGVGARLRPRNVAGCAGEVGVEWKVVVDFFLCAEF